MILQTEQKWQRCLTTTHDRVGGLKASYHWIPGQVDFDLVFRMTLQNYKIVHLQSHPVYNVLYQRSR